MEQNDKDAVLRRLILIAGLPGTGKTTIAEWLTKMDPKGVHFEADHFFEDECGRYQFVASQVGAAHKWCQEQVKCAMLNDTPLIVVANTFVKRWELDPYVDMAEQHGYEIVRVVMDNNYWTDEQLAARNIHKVPQAKITQMRANWE